ncbi:MAG: hypothetical protein HQL23_02210 [Candidatus Omnitrophica bacterium]|nr:hypothetical protein [Candidatus Omnitrophota bacterium]
MRAATFGAFAKTIDLSDPDIYLGTYLLWDSLQVLIAKYLGKEAEGEDPLRCQITLVNQTPDGTEIKAHILPPFRE